MKTTGIRGERKTVQNSEEEAEERGKQRVKIIEKTVEGTSSACKKTSEIQNTATEHIFRRKSISFGQHFIEGIRWLMLPLRQLFSCINFNACKVCTFPLMLHSSEVLAIVWSQPHSVSLPWFAIQLNVLPVLIGCHDVQDTIHPSDCRLGYSKFYRLGNQPMRLSESDRKRDSVCTSNAF